MTKLLSTLLISLFAAAVAAQGVAPDALVKSITVEVTDIVRQDKDIQAGHQKKIIDLVEAKVLPYFNFDHMTGLAMGRNWTKANPDQKMALTNEFRTLLVRTYSNALASYRDQAIEYKPLRAATGDADVTVKTLVKQPGTQAISIDYSMEKIASGWKVYDVVVGGVSLVTNYRETFNAEIRDGGVDGLIKSLASKNRGLDAQATSKPK